MRILLTGGTGALGTAIRALPRPAGMTITVMSRKPSREKTADDWALADLLTGEGLEQALSGVDVVVHAASDPRRSSVVDVPGTKRLVASARQAGVSHLLYVSIVGVDQIPYPYYRDKIACEEIVRQGGVPFSVLRLTQFHSFIDMLLTAVADRVPLVVALPTRFRVQSVDIGEAAAHLLAAALQAPGGRLRDFGGPEIMTVGEAAAAWRAARQVRKPILPLVWLPGGVARALTRGLNTAPDGGRGTITWQQWLRGDALRRQQAVSA